MPVSSEGLIPWNFQKYVAVPSEFLDRVNLVLSPWFTQLRLKLNINIQKKSTSYLILSNMVLIHVDFRSLHIDLESILLMVPPIIYQVCKHVTCSFLFVSMLPLVTNVLHLSQLIYTTSTTTVALYSLHTFILRYIVHVMSVVINPCCEVIFNHAYSDQTLLLYGHRCCSLTL